MTTEESKTIAETILAQLGGRKFIVMTGARHLQNDGAALVFKLPSNFATGGINVVRIELKADDTYTVTFSKLRGFKITQIAEVSDVYNDNLRRVFAMHTGLDCNL